MKVRRIGDILLYHEGYVSTGHVQDWTWPRGTQPARAVIDFPATEPIYADWPGDTPVAIEVNEIVVFRGIVTDVQRALTGDRKQVRVTALDMRHVLAGIPIALASVGPLTASEKNPGDTDGGWAGIGHELIFNRDGRPNRSASTTDGVYTFDLTDSAEYWTPKDMIEFLCYWYIPDSILLPNSDELTGPYQNPTGEVDCQGTVLNALNQITAQTGGDWLLAHGYSGTERRTWYMPFNNQIGAPYSITVNVDSQNTKTEINEYTAGSVNITESVRRTYDRVQVVSDKWLSETTYSDIGDPALLAKLTTDVDEMYICEYHIYPGAYKDYALGPDLANFAEPKKWSRELISRRADDGSIQPAGTLAGTPISADETIWISDDEGTNKYLVARGVDINYERCRLFPRKKIDIYDDSLDSIRTLELTDASKVRIWFTVVTELEFPLVSSTGDTSEYLSYTRTRNIPRRDLVPMYRYSSMLPDYSTNDPHDTQTFAGSGERYYDPEPLLEQYRDQYYAAFSQRTQQVRMVFPQFPGIALGWGISIAPADFNLDSLRVTHVRFDARNYNTIITAANNLDINQ